MTPLTRRAWVIQDLEVVEQCENARAQASTRPASFTVVVHSAFYIFVLPPSPLIPPPAPIKRKLIFQTQEA
ncbi:hypothetical protein GX50_01891 [[Emmonsia] crescens]|uniref:Uncharacterized protein n=1 Tax=[Emmonsia] crescens TaxID=73230 RepID=A0A2B7ZPL7_9EURO|nr:hypothetical protein GX50_01891 [Emmonsia crescens]